MSQSETIVLNLEARDRATAAITKVNAAADKLTSGIQSMSARFSRSAEEVAAAQTKMESSSRSAARAADVHRQAQTDLAAASTKMAAAEKQVAETTQAAADAHKAAAQKIREAETTAQQAAFAAAGAQNEQTKAIQKAADAASVAAEKAKADADLQKRAAADAAEAYKVAAGEEEAALRKVNDASGAATRKQAELATAQKEAGKSSNGMSTALGAVGVAAGTVAFGVGALAVESVKSAAGFQESMTTLVTGAGESQKNLEMVGQGVLAMSRATGTSTDQLISGLYMVESAGHHGADGLNILQAAAEGAKVGNADLKTTADAMTSAMNAYGPSIGSANQVMNQMVATVASGKMHMQDLASSLSAVLPVAASAGVSYAQVGGALATMTAQGMSAQQGTQDLANVIRTLEAPSGVAINRMEQLGLDANDVSKNLGQRGLTGTLDTLTKAITDHMGPAGLVMQNSFNQSKSAAQDAQTMLDKLPPSIQQVAKEFLAGTITNEEWRKAVKAMPADQAGLAQSFAGMALKAHGFNDLLKSGKPEAETYTAAMKDMLGGATGLNVGLLLTGNNMATFQSNVDTVGEAAKKTGDHVEGWDEVQKDFNTHMEQLHQTLATTGIAIGTALLPMVTRIADIIGKVVGPMAEWVNQHQKLAAILIVIATAGGGALAFFIGTVIVVGSVVRAMRELSVAIKAVEISMKALQAGTLIGLALMVLVIVAMLIITHWSQVKAFLAPVWAWMKVAAADVAAFFVAAWRNASSSLQAVWAAILVAVHAVVDFFVSSWRGAVGVLREVWHGITAAWDATGGKAVQWIVRQWDQAKGPLLSAWTYISESLRTIWAMLVQIWDETGGQLVAFIGRHWGLIQKIFMVSLAIIVGYVTFYWNLIKDVITVSFDIIRGIVTIAWDVIRGIFVAVWDVIWTFIKVVWDEIVGVFSVGFDLIKGIVGVAWDVIKGIFQVAWDLIWGIIKTALDLITGIIAFWMDLFRGNWSQVWTDVKDLCQTVLHDINSIIANVFGDIWNTVAAILTDLWHTCEAVWNSILDTIMSVARSIWDGLKTGFRDAVNVIGSIWDDLKRAFGTPIEFVIRTILNAGLIDGINVILDKVGLKIPHIPDPNLPTFAGGGVVPGYAPGRDSVHAMLSPGEGVLTPQATRELGGAPAIAAINRIFGSRGGGPSIVGGTQMFADGGVAGFFGGLWQNVTGAVASAWSAVKNVALGGLRMAASGFFDVIVNPLLGMVPGGDGIAAKLLRGEVKDNIETQILSLLGGKDQAAMASGVSMMGAFAGNVMQWIAAAEAATGVGGEWTGPLAVIIAHESGGDPNAQNNWDSNAAAGDPSRGLMQTIMSTFNAYRLPTLSPNIFDPVSNIAAGIRYIQARYNGIGNVPGIRSMAAGGPYVGYENGTWDTGPRAQMALLHPHEAVMPAGVARGFGGTVNHILVDMRGCQLMSDRDMDVFVDKLGSRLATWTLPSGGVQIRG